MVFAEFSTVGELASRTEAAEIGDDGDLL